MLRYIQRRLLVAIPVILGVATIVVSHDLGVIRLLTSRTIVMRHGCIVEEGLSDQILEDPQHPYTLGLLGALPRLDDTGGRRLASIEGFPPDLLSAPSHCQFAFRCPYAQERCWHEIPSLMTAGVRHRVACFYDVERGMPRDVA